MNDPLRIFNKDQLKTLNPFHLQRLKKEFFIPFKFGGASTVVLNNHEIDRATLEAIFTELELNLDDYLIDTQNETLNDFLFTGNLEFLYNEKMYNEIIQVIKSNLKLELKVAQKLSHIISDICQNISKHSFYTLETINKFTSLFRTENREIVYQKCFEEVKAKIDMLRNDDYDPFANEYSTEYKIEVGHFVNISMADMFYYLPGQFRILDRKYSGKCRSIIVNKTAKRETNLNKFGKKDLQIFLDACKIASKYYDTPTLQNNIKIVSEARKEKDFSYKGFSGILGVILLIVTIGTAIMRISRMDSPSPFSSNQSNYDTRDDDLAKFNELITKKIEERESNKTNPSSQRPTKFTANELGIIEGFARNNKSDESNKTEAVTDFRTGFSRTELIKNYTGEIHDIFTIKENFQSDNNDTLNVVFATDLFPSLIDMIPKILFSKTSKAKKTLSNVANVTFVNSDLNFETSHILNLDNKDIENSQPEIYQSRQSDTNAKLALSAKRIPYGNYNVKGYIITKETKSGSIKEKIAFNIKYDRSDKQFKVVYSRNQFLELSKADVTNPSDIRDKENIYMKFAFILNNLGILHNKYLSQGNWYSIENIPEYKIQSQSKINENTFGLQERKGNLRFNFTSIADNIAYCELHTKDTALKYMVDHKSGITKGMIRSTVSLGEDEVEQVIVIRQ